MSKEAKKLVETRKKVKQLLKNCQHMTNEEKKKYLISKINSPYILEIIQDLKL